LAKVAIELEYALTRRRRDGTPGSTTPRIIAGGDDWTVADVVCTCGPHDRPYEERHVRYVIAIVLAGSFQYRSPRGRGLMTPGSLMLGNHGECFECGHQHGEGDRCVSFWYAPEYFERLAADAGVAGSGARFTRFTRFKAPLLPPLRPLTPLTVRAGAGASGVADVAWDELAIALAARTVRLAAGVPSSHHELPLNAEARVTQAVRTIDHHPDAALTLDRLAREAGLSPYHFLRTFKSLTGITPHQYVLRARLRDAAWRLATDTDKVLDVALDCGFNDVSNFNRAFRAEFGLNPRSFRRTIALTGRD
jgi:AraC family transcriptional regulator